LNEALEVLKEEECIIFAGGTDLMVKRKRWSGVEPGFDKPVLFIEGLKEISEIRVEGNMLSIGGATPISMIINNPLVPDFMKPIFSQMASPAIRNTATLGGNICNSSPAGDSLPLLYALDAVLVLQKSGHRREVAVQDFIKGPGRNIAESCEILTEAKIPIPDFDAYEYRKVGTRKSTALSKLSFMGCAKVKEGKISDIRLAFGAVGPTVVRDREMEKKIIEMSLDGPVDIHEIKNMYSRVINPIDDQRSSARYRKETALRLLEDFIVNKALKG
jgi:CO/xanthine dehydrogenase FAD-binding subunit